LSDVVRSYFPNCDERTEPIPALVAGIVEEISLHELFPLEPKREAGIYLHGSARAEVEPKFINGRMQNRICVTAKEMKDLQEVYEGIRVGSIRRPDKSYEGEQDGMSRKELEAQLKEARESVEELGREYDRFRSLLEKADDRITELSSLEGEGLWVFLRRKLFGR